MIYTDYEVFALESKRWHAWFYVILSGDGNKVIASGPDYETKAEAELAAKEEIDSW